MTDYTPQVGRIVQETREALGISQRELAEKVGFAAAQTISDIELGKREVKARELVALARALGTEVTILLGLTEAGPVARVLWRRKSPIANRSREHDLIRRAKTYAQLERWCGDEPPMSLPDFPINPRTASENEVAQLAEQLRRSLDLGSIPAASLLAMLEDSYGVKIFYEDLTRAEDGDCSAASVRGEFGAAILIDASEAPWRRNYNVAHELFHLVTWNSVAAAWRHDAAEGTEPSWYPQLEHLADVFAAHLLLPAEPLTTHFNARIKDNRITYMDLIQLARDFGVSTHALLRRLHSLGRFSEAAVDEVRKNPEFIAADEGSFEWAWQGKPDIPFTQRYQHLAMRAYRQGIIGISKLAEVLEQQVGELMRFEQDLSYAGEATITVA